MRNGTTGEYVLGIAILVVLFVYFIGYARRYLFETWDFILAGNVGIGHSLVLDGAQ